jgi:DNA-binding MarR family transcriptional regulator
MASAETTAGADMLKPARRRGGQPESPAYRLDAQVGFLLRRASQRHVAIFASRMGKAITTTRWAALAKLYEEGPTSQNLLGRNTAMDAATIKGVVDRLTRLQLIETRADPDDARRRVVALTEAGHRLVERSMAQALAISEETLAPLAPAERVQLLGLLRKLG